MHLLSRKWFTFFYFLLSEDIMVKNYLQKFIKVDEIHTVAYREYGNPDGIPVLMLHGGPGGKINFRILELIDLTFYRVFTIDQRGCGLSTPKGELRANTLLHLISDMEAIRQKEKLGKCIIFGRSWGTVLGLMYALKYPQNCLRLILRGIFLGRNTDELWTFEQSKIRFPQQWAEFSDGLTSSRPLNEQFYEKIFSQNEKTALLYSSKMTHYFNILATNKIDIPAEDETLENLTANKIFLHYSVHHYFFEDMFWDQHLAELDANNIHGVILHGGKDSDCLPEQAYYLHNKWKKSTLIIEPNVSHCDNQVEIRKQIHNIFRTLKLYFSHNK